MPKTLSEKQLKIIAKNNKINKNIFFSPAHTTFKGRCVMKGGFFAGIALGAMMGAVLLELSPQAKQIAKDSQQAVAEQIKNMTK